jgi:LCP family protein required for cell wall assembly
MSEPAAHLPHAGHPRARRIVKWVAVIVVLLLVAGAAAGFYLYKRFEGNIGVLDVGDDLGTNRPTKVVKDPEADTEPMNILVMGSDTREGQDRNYGRDVTGARSDTTLLVHLPADREGATVVSIPRDTIVDLPSCRTDTGMSTPYRDRFNAAFSIGGPACTIKTVEQNTGVFIDHYVIVDFSGFNDIVDALGGVEVCLPEAVVDPQSGLDLPAGRSTVRGDQALAFVRVRAIGTGSDIDRIDRQQAFISSLITKAKSSGTLLNPVRLIPFLEAATKSLTVDPGLKSLNKLRQLAQEVKDIPLKDITFITTPWVVNPEDPNTVVWNTSKTDKLWKAIINDETYPPEPPEPTVVDGKPLDVAPSAIAVRVLNGSGVDGVATKASRDLDRLGYNIVGVGDADSSDFTSTVVRFDPTYPGSEDAARTLSASLGGVPRVIRAGLGSTLEVVVGENWPEVQDNLQKVAVKRIPSDDGVRKASENICKVPG